MADSQTTQNYLGPLVTLLFMVGLFFVASFVDLLTCPQCHNTILLNLLCDLCGHDGKVTILKYLLYVIF